MLKTELKYNPYLLNTEIKFNGQLPRINSLVEKYMNCPLQKWVDNIPKIFYDEMNGYDFEVEFYGTKLDYNQLTKSFKKALSKEDHVTVFHKLELENRETKQKRIDDLLEWLKNNQNDNFDFSSFVLENNDLFYGSFPYLILNGSTIDVSVFDGTDIGVEKIESLNEIKNTDLADVPILYHIDKNSIKEIQKNIDFLLNCKKIQQCQLFFMINSVLNQSEVERILQDIGIKHPQIVEKINDDCIVEYIKMFPITNYIFDSVRVFRSVTDVLKLKFDEIVKKSEIKNKAITDKINTIEKNIERLKAVRSLFANHQNIEILSGWSEAQDKYFEGINSWRLKKTKMTKFDEALQAASDFENTVNTLNNNFVFDLNNATIDGKNSILCEYKDWYCRATLDIGYCVEDFFVEKVYLDSINDLASSLLDIKEENLVSPKDDLFGRIIKKHSDDVSVEVVYYYQSWREYVYKKIEPITSSAINRSLERLQIFADKTAYEYISHIDSLLDKQNIEKEGAISKLSGEEKANQNDNEWLTQFIEQLELIEG